MFQRGHPEAAVHVFMQSGWNVWIWYWEFWGNQKTVSGRMAGPDTGISMCLAITGCNPVRPHEVVAALDTTGIEVYGSYNNGIKRKHAVVPAPSSKGPPQNPQGAAFGQACIPRSRRTGSGRRIQDATSLRHRFETACDHEHM